MTLDSLGGTLATCITCEAYFFWDEPDSLSSANPQVIIFIVWGIVLCPRSSYMLQDLLVREVINKGFCGGVLILFVPQPRSCIFFKDRLFVSASQSHASNVDIYQCDNLVVEPYFAGDVILTRTTNFDENN